MRADGKVFITRVGKLTECGDGNGGVVAHLGC